MTAPIVQIKAMTNWEDLRRMRIRSIRLHPTLFSDSVETAINFSTSYWKELAAKNGNKFFGLYHQERCVGYTGIVNLNSDSSMQTALIGYTFIEPEYRGNGYVNLFFKARLKHAITNLNWKRVVTDHREGNEVSQKAILQHGFVFTERALINWPDGSQGYELRYSLDLNTLRSR
jgi:RimJ/RimL family protein N-acetyltransferase